MELQRSRSAQGDITEKKKKKKRKLIIIIIIIIFFFFFFFVAFFVSSTRTCRKSRERERLEREKGSICSLEKSTTVGSLERESLEREGV